MKKQTAAILIGLVLVLAAIAAYFFEQKAKKTALATSGTVNPNAVATNADVLKALNNITFKIQ